AASCSAISSSLSSARILGRRRRSNSRYTWMLRSTTSTVPSSVSDAAPVHGEQRVGAARTHHFVDQDVLVVGVRHAQVARPVADGGRAALRQPARVLDGGK